MHCASHQWRCVPVLFLRLFLSSATLSFRGKAIWSSDEIAKPDAQGQKLLREAAETMRLSARGYHRVLRVARTLADLDHADRIGRLHLAEALSYRALGDEARHAA